MNLGGNHLHKKIQETHETNEQERLRLTDDECRELLDELSESTLTREDFTHILNECGRDSPLLEEQDTINETQELLRSALSELEEEGRLVLSLDPELLTSEEFESLMKRGAQLVEDVKSADPDEVRDLIELRDLYKLIASSRPPSRRIEQEWRLESERSQDGEAGRKRYPFNLE